MRNLGIRNTTFARVKNDKFSDNFEYLINTVEREATMALIKSQNFATVYHFSFFAHFHFLPLCRWTCGSVQSSYASRNHFGPGPPFGPTLLE